MSQKKQLKPGSMRAGSCTRFWTGILSPNEVLFAFAVSFCNSPNTAWRYHLMHKLRVALPLFCQFVPVASPSTLYSRERITCISKRCPRSIPPSRSSVFLSCPRSAKNQKRPLECKIVGCPRRPVSRMSVQSLGSRFQTTVQLKPRPTLSRHEFQEQLHFQTKGDSSRCPDYENTKHPSQ